MFRRVVVTGFGGITALGHDWKTIRANLHARRSGVKFMDEWDTFSDLNTKLAAPVAPYELPPQYNRKTMRSMGPVAVMSTRATELALEDAKLIGNPVLTSGRTGIAYGACAGSAESTVAFGRMATSGSLKGVTSNTYVQMMSHTGAVNISLFFGITGRIIPSSSACTSASQAIGFAYETIRYGKQSVMVAGGGDELSMGSTAVFDTLFATSTKNSAPDPSMRR